MKSICIVTSRYPTNVDRTALVFVQQLAWTMSDMGIKVDVICPLPLNRNWKFLNVPDETFEKTSKGTLVNLYFPKFFDLGQKNLIAFNTSVITTYNFMKSVGEVVGKMPQKPDVIYGHFITPSGVTAARIGRKFGIPSFFAYGESSPWTIEQYGPKRVIKELSSTSGVISVSTKNKNDLINLRISSSERIKVFPNGVRVEHFYERDKIKARNKFGIKKDTFVVGFVGHFIKRKGIDKLIQAISELEDVHAIYAGKGEISPKGNKCLYADLVDPNDLPEFYSAADVFVLPTLNEGCCNAIIEAMACGLPIISSNLPFNDDILNDTCSIKINPNSVEEIKNAINKLKNDKTLYKQLKDGSLEKAKSLSLKLRTKNIIDFINTRIQYVDCKTQGDLE